MIVGVAEITIYVPWVHSLKEKRRIIKSICAKIRNKFNMRTKRTHVFYDADSFSNPLFSCVNFPKT